MAFENRAQIIPLRPERGVLRSPVGGVANTANIAATTTVNYTARLRPFLNDEIPASKESKMSDVTREEIKAGQDLAEAKTDLKFAQLIGKIDTANADLKGEIRALSAHFIAVERSTAGVKATIIVTAVAVLAIVVGVLGFGQQWFGIGMSARDLVRATVKELQEQPATTTQSAPKPQK